MTHAFGYTRAREFVRWALLGLLIAQCALVCARLCLKSPPIGEANWPEGLLLVLCVVVTLMGLSPDLPLQNILLAVFAIALISGAAVSLGALTGIPFGPITFGKNFGQQLFYPLPWASLFLWTAVVLNARGVARLLLRNVRNQPSYGLWLIGLSAILAMVFDLALEPFATRVKHYWIWQPTKTSLIWYGAPWANSFGWVVTTVLILAFATPALIVKRPGPRQDNYHPLIIWLLINSLLAVGAASNHLWPPVLLACVHCLVITFCALVLTRPKS